LVLVKWASLYAAIGQPVNVAVHARGTRRENCLLACKPLAFAVAFQKRSASRSWYLHGSLLRS
jgi:hypothetical protein